MNGGRGRDLIINSGGGRDVFNGGQRRDKLQTDVTGLTEDILVFDALQGIHGRTGDENTIGRDTVISIEDFELIGDWNGEITGNGAANWFLTDGGDDILLGRGGNDTLNGKGGTNTLNGGTGNDTYIHDGRDGGRSTITDAGGTDILRVIDTPERDPGEFINIGSGLIWRPFDRKSSVEIAGDGTGGSVVETLNWVRFETLEAGITGYEAFLDIVTDLSQIGGDALLLQARPMRMISFLQMSMSAVLSARFTSTQAMTIFRSRPPKTISSAFMAGGAMMCCAASDLGKTISAATQGAIR